MWEPGVFCVFFAEWRARSGHESASEMADKTNSGENDMCAKHHSSRIGDHAPD